MNEQILEGLEKLNQLRLSEGEKAQVLAFFEKQNKKAELLDSVDTENVKRMVYVMPLFNVTREDKIIKNFTRQQLQADAPEANDGYWSVPRLVE